MTTKGIEVDDVGASGMSAARMAALPKAPTGISGLDEVTGGGLPQGRPTLVCGPAGCGKTLLAMEFLVRGITQFDEPGVFVAFEESAHDLVANVASLGFDLAQYEADGKLVIDHVSVVRGELEETGGASGHQPHLQRTFAIPRAPVADRANGLKCDSSSTRFRSGSGSSRSAPSIRHGSDARERPCTIPSRVSGDS